MDKYDRYPNGHDLALAAYNAGQANVDGWIADGTPGGKVRIPFRETRDYVDSLNELTETYRTAYGAELDDAP
jgi:soluble lytic murein transglycosylase